MSSFRRARLALPIALIACSAASCASVEFNRTTPTSGTFRSSGTAFTILSIDIPKEALQIARENAADAGQPNLQVTKSSVIPNLGWWDWLIDIIGVRYAVIEGTWGFVDAAPAK